MNEEIVFVQLSDPHILASDGELFGVRPAERLQRTLDHLLALPIEPAFCLITGDLAQDGEEASYRRLRALLAPLAERGIPIMAGLGNHDQRAQFRRGFLDQETDVDAHYFHAAEFAGLRIIMLDSLVAGSDAGELGAVQREWLAHQLAGPTPRGTIVALHHPVVLGGMPWLANDLLRDAAALAETLQGRNIIGVLAGHCHTASAAHFAGTLAVTAPATAFQAIPGVEHFATRPGSGFNLCTVQDGALLVTTVMI